MRFRWGGERAGTRLSTRLIALVLVPLLGISAFAAWEVRQRYTSAHDAARVAGLLEATARISAVRSDLLLELVPSIGRAIVTVPAVSDALGLRSVSAADLGVTGTQIATLRRRTDAALRELAGEPATDALAARTTHGVTVMRSGIDSGAIPAGFAAALGLTDRLSAAQNALVGRAGRLGLDGPATQAARETTLTAEVVELGELELPYMAGTLFPSLAPHGTTEAVIPRSLQVWGGYRSALAMMRAQAPPVLRNALDRATGTPQAVRFDAIAAKVALDPSSLTTRELIGLYKLDQVRGRALTGVLDLSVTRAVAAARAQRDAAVTEELTIAATVVALLVVSILIGWGVLRSIAVPLRTLAASARRVGDGILDDVVVAGPREVRTVARGLAAAVASLRRVASQAYAVAAGDLDSDVVRRPLPGPLGEAMHCSVETIVGAIHERDAAQTDLAYRAAHDPLTELTNRGQAMVAIASALHRARRNGSITGLMFIDLDHFKAVNDTHGHEAGDTVLVHCAARMSDCVRAGDTVARLGGDEFVILLENISDGIQVVRLAERVVRVLGEPIDIGTREVRVGASVGVALCTDSDTDAGRLLRDADAAAYAAKKAGRGRYSIFDDELRRELARRTAMDKAIAEALRRDQLVLHYQPVVDLATNRPTGVEALIRWDRPGFGLIPPNEFIPVAENSQLINEIGRWTLIEATAQLARWDGQLGDRRLTVAVNISGRHLVGDELLGDVERALTESGICPNRLIIEVTETVLVDQRNATQNLAALRGLGVRVAIDDFGTGFTSIGQLLSLPVDTLKIDRSFVTSAEGAQRELVELMTRAAHTFGLSVVAEGVEEPEQLDLLARCAVESAQGFHFARPHTADDVLELLRMPCLPARAALIVLPPTFDS